MTQTSFTITNGEGSAATTNTDTTSLNGAIRSIDVGGSNAATNTNYTITLTASITLSAADLLAINLPSGSSLTIVGGNFSINGNGNQRGLFVYSGNVTVQDLTITNAQALGGAGASAGGGGAGLVGGLFVASAGVVTLDNVTFSSDKATGGAGGNTGSGGGGGGGMGGNGGGGQVTVGGGGGGLGLGANGGAKFGHNGAAGIIPGTAGGGSGHGVGGGSGGPSGGGGGGGWGGGAAGGGGVGGQNGGQFAPGSGGFGGGGGAPGAAGGFGGGGGGGYSGGHGGFGGGGGGGLGAGGDIFVQQGGTLTIEGGTLSGGTVTGGNAGAAVVTHTGANGAAYGTGIFIQGNQSVTFAPASGKTLTISDVITDQSGNGGTGANAGSGSVIDAGAGTVVLSGGNTYTGGTTISGGGILELAVSGAAGSGTIAFGGSGGTLQIDGAAFTGATFSNTIDQFAVGDVLDLRGLAFASGATAQYDSGGQILTVSGGGVSEQLTLTNPASTNFATPTTDGSGGTRVTLFSPRPSVSTDATASWREGAAPTTVSPHLTITDSGPSTLISATVAITSGTFSGDGDVLGFNTSGTSISGSYNSATETLTLSGTDTLANYQSVLEGVTFSAAANPTDFGADPTRTLTFTVNDGSASGSGSTTVNITPTTIYVISGQTSSGLTISGGITLDVLSGGTALATTVTSGGMELVQSGGNASGSLLDGSGSETVSGGGTDLGAIISGGTQLDFGYASGTTIFSGGSQLPPAERQAAPWSMSAASRTSTARPSTRRSTAAVRPTA
jgi:hypothetical protein